MSFLTLAFQTAAKEVSGTVQSFAEATDTANEIVQQSGGGASHLILLLTVFALAVFVGVEIIAKIPPTLHTPLMSGSNAISGITLVGAILAAGGGNGVWAGVLGLAAVVLATMNVVGGFVVTNRMLAMFKSKK